MGYYHISEILELIDLSAKKRVENNEIVSERNVNVEKKKTYADVVKQGKLQGRGIQL